jgi:uncharacterized protein (DUF2267 family)
VPTLSTNITSLDRSIQTALQWLSDIQGELQWDDKEKVYKATKAVLQVIRDRLPVEELVHLTANLPLIMKGMIMDGYDLKEKPLRIRTPEEFYYFVQEYYDYRRVDLVDSADVVHAVLNVLSRRIGAGEMTKLAANLPPEVRRLFEQELQAQL